MSMWNPLDTPINKAVVAGQLTPGICSVEKASSPRKWDEVGGWGADGAVTVYHGRKLVAFDMIIKLFTQQDWEEWHAFAPLIMKQGKNALMVWHPYLAMLEVFSAVVTDVSQPRDLGTGEYEITISFLEYRKPKPATLAKPATAQGPQPPQDPAEKYIDQLIGQVQLEAMAS